MGGKNSSRSSFVDILIALFILGVLSIYIYLSSLAISITSDMMIRNGTRIDCVVSFVTSFIITVLNIIVSYITIVNVIETITDNSKNGG